MKHLKIWTDGSYRGSVNVGGIGVVIVDDDDNIIERISEGFEDTTNNKMEIMAIHKCLEYIKDNPADMADVYTDSQYCVGILTKQWKIQKNIYEWIQLRKLLDSLSCKITFHHVKGHDSDLYNMLADELATDASNKLKKQKTC